MTQDTNERLFAEIEHLVKQNDELRAGVNQVVEYAGELLNEAVANAGVRGVLEAHFIYRATEFVEWSRGARRVPAALATARDRIQVMPSYVARAIKDGKPVVVDRRGGFVSFVDGPICWRCRLWWRIVKGWRVRR